MLQRMGSVEPTRFCLRREELRAGTEVLCTGALQLTAEQRCDIECPWQIISQARRSAAGGSKGGSRNSKKQHKARRKGCE